MSSSANVNLILEANNLNYMAMMFIRCYCFIVIPIGTIGHLLNIYAFTRPSLRSNSCSRYFLAASIIGIMHTLYALPMRMIQSAFVDIDPGAYSVVFCKITWLCLNSLRSSGFWLIVLASVDRYLCSSAPTYKRGWSGIHVANRVIPLTIINHVIAHIDKTIVFRISNIPALSKLVCCPPDYARTYRIILSYFNLVSVGLVLCKALPT
ncbi:hypothetical protein I4U23_001344 [Adineta vaga]|nr:hypothetical protein I4U23_001344 [Adineta vaga]